MAELRQIRTLRLGASRREQVARATIALEDALRTASMPPMPSGALLLVRRLNLGRLPAKASPQWLSRHIEARLRALRPTSLDVHRRDERTAPVVWFADRSDALASLIAATLRQAPQAWYWRGVLPDWRPNMPLRALLPLVLRHAEAEPEPGAGPVTVAALLERMLAAGHLDEVLVHLEPEHVASAAPALPRSVPLPPQSIAEPFYQPRDAVAPSPRAPAIPLPPPRIADEGWQEVLSRWIVRWGASRWILRGDAADPRSHWLAAHALIAVHGPAAAAHAGRLVAQLSPSTPIAPQGRTPPAVEQAARSSSRTMPWPQDIRAEEPEEGRVRIAPGRAAEEPGKAEQGMLPEDPREERGQSAPEADPWQPTRYAGLLLILPALARLELAEADAEGDLCLHLLHRIADRLRIRRDDVIRRALPRPLPRTEPWDFVPPAAWHGLRRLPRGLDLGGQDGLLAACQLVLARFLRRHAKISLRRLVRRPALVHATRTHIDLCFDARWVELEVRLAGLDLDPGWVPWLGRVVSFHYDYEGRT